MIKYYKDDRPEWSGEKEHQSAKWRGMLLEVHKVGETVVDGWTIQQWLFKVTDGYVLSKYSNVVGYEDDAKHCAEGAARDFSNGDKKEQ